MGIKETGEILSNPLKMQQYQLQALMIKAERNRWRYAAFGWAMGLLTAIVPVIVVELTQPDPVETNEQELLEVVRSQADLIRRLEAESTNLRETLDVLQDSLGQR